MKIMQTICVAVMMVLTFMVSGSGGQTSVGRELQAKSPDAAPIEKIGPGVFRMGEIQIHKGARSVTFPAEVNMEKGLLEYLLVCSSGKTHESLLRTNVSPYELNIALLLLGFEGTDAPQAEQGAADAPRGEPVEIMLIYPHKNKNERTPAAAWITMKVGEKEESPVMEWVYTGSKIFEGKFLAQEQGSVVAIYHDPAALFDNRAPNGGNDEIWFVNERAVPPVGTPVTVIIRAQQD